MALINPLLPALILTQEELVPHFWVLSQSCEGCHLQTS
jgi:hypothetical protein